MRQSLDNVFFRPSHTTKQTPASIKSTQTQKMKSQLSASQSSSYLVYSKHVNYKQRKQNSLSKLPEILRSQIELPLQFVQSPAVEKTMIIKSRIGSSQIKYKTESIRDLPSPVGSVKQDYVPTLPSETQLTLNQTDLSSNAILGEGINMVQQMKTRKTNFQIETNQYLCEIEQFNEKSMNLIRKVVQLIKTNREKNQEKNNEQETVRRRKNTQLKNEIDRGFSGVQMPTIQDDRSPKNKEEFFKQQISVIPRNHTKTQSTFNYVHLAESLKPMKSLLDAMKDKGNEIKKDEKTLSSPPTVSQFQKRKSVVVVQKKKMKLCVIGAGETDGGKQMEFDYPSYLEEDSQIQINQTQNEGIEVKDTKKQNIYSMVSKSILQKKFVNLMVHKLGNKIIEKQTADQNLEDFNSYKAQQYTRYYLQNNIIKSLGKQYSIQKVNENSRNQLNILKQESWNNDLNIAMIMALNTIGTNKSDQSQQKEFQHKYFEIQYQLYKVQRSFDSQTSFCDGESEMEEECSQMGDVAGFKLFYINSSTLVNPWKIRNILLKPIISSIDDESKNTFLHQEIIQYQNKNILLDSMRRIENSHRQQDKPLLLYLSELVHQLNKRDRRKLTKQFYLRFDHILTGQFQDVYKEKVTFLQKAFILQIKGSQSLDSTKTITKLKLKESTLETIPKDQKQMILSLPPKSKNDSSSSVSETKTQKTTRQKSERVLQQTQKSRKLLIQPTQNQINLSVVKENGLIKSTKDFKPIVENNKDYKSISHQQSMDPFSLLFRNMLITQTLNFEKSSIQKVFTIIEEHRLLDLKEIFKHDNNVTINTMDDQGNSLLIYAAKTGAPMIVQYLLQNGADIQHKNDVGKTALQVALENYQFTTADVINSFVKSHEENHSLL